MMSSADDLSVQYSEASKTRNGFYDSHSRKKMRRPTRYETFNYESLPKKRGAIRLLKLVPSSAENPDVECELITPMAKSTESYSYEALSWCWGTDDNKAYINIRKGRKIYAKYISPNLFNALKALRDPIKDRYLWVDAICIDQDDLDEKNHQVEMMYDIYGNADRVCIWLGEANQSSTIALKFIKKEVLQLRDFDELCDRVDASKKWRALLELMQRDWFSRRWVVQEIALAKDAVIYCGQDKIPWKDFAIAVELFVEVETATHRLSEVMKKDSKHVHVPGLFEHVSALGASLLVDATDRLFRDYKQEHQASIEVDENESTSDTDSDSESDASSTTSILRASKSGKVVKPPSGKFSSSVAKSTMQPLLSLEYLVTSLTIFDTKMPHDTIYALLAIAKDTTPRAAGTDEPRSSDYVRQGLEVFTQRKRYNVDYDLPYVDVCKEFIQFVIERALQVDPSRALDVICRPWATEQKKLDSIQRTNQRDKEKKERMEQRKEKRERRRHAKKNAQVAHSDHRAEQQVTSQVETNLQSASAGTRQDMPLPSWVPQLSGAPFGMHQLAGMTGPKMSRKNADPLVGLPSSTHRSYSAAETKKVDMKTLKFRKRFEQGHYSMYVRGFQLDTISRVEQVARNGQIPKEWADLAEWPDAKGSPPEAFWRTLVADRGRDGKNPPVYYSRACTESFKKGGYESGAVNTTDLMNYERNSVVSQFCRRVQAVIWNRALVKTSKGRLGLVGKGVEEGDKICILYGLSVPVVLRESKRKDEEMMEKELETELKFLANTIGSQYKQYVRRKRQHERRKSREKAELMKQWAKSTAWLQTNGFSREHGFSGRTGADIMALTKKAFKDFSEWKVEKRKQNYSEEPEETENVKEQPSNRTFGKKRMDEIVQRRQKESKLKDEKNDKEPPWASQEDSSKHKASVDWWDFEYQLKAGRRWKRIVKERRLEMSEYLKSSAQVEWDKKKAAEFKAFESARKKAGLWIDPPKDVIVPDQSVADKKHQSMMPDHGLRHVYPSLKQVEGEKRFSDSPEPVRGLDGDLDTSAGAEEHSEFGGSTIMMGRTSTSFTSVTPASTSPREADNVSDLNGKVRPSWTTKRVRKVKGSIEKVETDDSREIPKKSMEVKEDLEVQREGAKWIDHFKNNLRERQGEDGYFSYKLLGECYIHGMMDGEAMLYQNEGDEEDNEVIPSMVFEIR